MGQKVNPISFRLGYIRGCESNWVVSKKDFAHNLCEDNTIRNYLFTYFPKEIISKSVIDRTLKNTTLTIHTSKPGIIIGQGGSKLVQFTKNLKKLCNKEVQINVIEIRNPELDAYLVATSIATQLSARMPYKRVIKQAISSSISSGAKGIKIRISGRLAGAEIARSEEYKDARIPLHTLRADIDYSNVEAKTTYGIIGIKVWIFKRQIYGKHDLSLNLEVRSQQGSRPAKRFFNKK